MWLGSGCDVIFSRSFVGGHVGWGVGGESTGTSQTTKEHSTINSANEYEPDVLNTFCARQV